MFSASFGFRPCLLPALGATPCAIRLHNSATDVPARLACKAPRVLRGCGQLRGWQGFDGFRTVWGLALGATALLTCLAIRQEHAWWMRAVKAPAASVLVRLMLPASSSETFWRFHYAADVAPQSAPDVFTFKTHNLPVLLPLVEPVSRGVPSARLYFVASAATCLWDPHLMPTLLTRTTTLCLTGEAGRASCGSVLPGGL
jgi:hypothetical protein